MDLCHKVMDSNTLRVPFMKWVKPEEIYIKGSPGRINAVIYKKGRKYAAVEYQNNRGVIIKKVIPVSMIKYKLHGNTKLHNSD